MTDSDNLSKHLPLKMGCRVKSMQAECEVDGWCCNRETPQSRRRRCRKQTNERADADAQPNNLTRLPCPPTSPSLPLLCTQPPRPRQVREAQGFLNCDNPSQTDIAPAFKSVEKALNTAKAVNKIQACGGSRSEEKFSADVISRSICD